MTDDRPRFSATDKRKCIQRELAMRLRVYPGWVDAKRMEPLQAKREIALMEAILEDYKAQEKRDRGQEELKL